VSELRVGSVHNGRFVNPTVFINNGKDTITGRTLINDRAICPEAQERVPVGNPIRTFRLSLNLLGDGFVEAIPDQVLIDLAPARSANSAGRISMPRCSRFRPMPTSTRWGSPTGCCQLR
jgi:hypothetical protein